MDYRVLVSRGRKKAQEYYSVYRESIPVAQIVREQADVMQEFTQSGGVRPFGISLMIAGYDDSGPQLFQVDPSGTYFGWKASAIGKNHVNAKSFLEKRYNEDVELEDAITAENIEIGVTGEDRVFKVLTPAQVQDYLS